jgi:glycosyltransferase involved in cell wall biosynthesis
VLFPATKSHFPRPLIEGMAMKKMALAFDIAGIEEVVKDEQNGLVINALTPMGLAQAINRLASMPAGQHEKMSEFGYQYARSNFSVSNIEQISKIYDEI